MIGQVASAQYNLCFQPLPHQIALAMLTVQGSSEISNGFGFIIVTTGDAAVIRMQAEIVVCRRTSIHLASEQTNRFKTLT